jgi:hypothetical protein
VSDASRREALQSRRHALSSAERSFEFFEKHEAEIKTLKARLDLGRAARAVAAAGVMKYASNAGRARRRAEKLGADHFTPSANAVIDALERTQLAVAKDGHWKGERDEMRACVRASVDAELKRRGAR